ncbi:universal stress protein [Streptomyces endophyticus]|uniref:Universal stress protein n=1 Tax=Streptomyces endophyticus TaxID=714166 RepID=A0ABU6F2Z3_9ACTN|nr:universal stress protein [Streptomyces endophyticus]MEB8338354.1 universal stress protein [Streptomyces endophyticus]
MAGHLLVGVDGSESSLEAVAVAAHEARRRGLGVRILNAFTWPMLKFPHGSSSETTAEPALRRRAEETVAAAVERARAEEPDLGSVQGEVVTGEALTVLAARSRDADLLVVGSRGLGAFSGLLVGSIAVHLAAHADCPVLVVRGRAHPEGPVAVAVDGSDAAKAAVEEGFDEAARRGTGLLAVHVWNTWSGTGPAGPGGPAPLWFDTDKLREDSEQALSGALAAGRARHPDVEVEARSVHGRVRPSLIETSQEASLLVVGARGRGGFQGLLLGSVSQALLQHAECPVLVMRR